MRYFFAQFVFVVVNIFSSCQECQISVTDFMTMFYTTLSFLLSGERAPLTKSFSRNFF